MRNIIIGPAHPFRGGIAHFSESLAQAFIRENLNTVLVTFTFQYPRFLFPGVTQLDEGPAPAGLQIHRLIHSMNPVSWSGTAKFIKEQKPGYVVFQYWMPFMAPCLGTLARWIKRHSGIKVFAVVHNVTPHEAGIFNRLLSGYFYRSCDGFITLSSSVLDDLSQFNPNVPARAVHHPVYDFFGEKTDRNSALKFLNLNAEKKYLLFFGLIRKYKGLDLLIHALSDPLLKDQEIVLIVAGEFYDKKQDYLDLIEQAGIAGRVILADRYIPNDEVKYYFAAADLVVQPYKAATQSGVTQIAYHFERPMLVSNVGGLPEIVPHMEVGYVTELSSNSIAEAINDFYVNHREQQFVKNVVAGKHKFQWEQVVSEIEALYAGVYGTG